MRQLLLIVAIIVFSAGSAWGQDTAKDHTKSSLRGIELGSSIANLKECPNHSNPAALRVGLGPTYILQEDPDYPENMKGVRCFKHAEHGPLLPIASSYIIDNLPFIKGAGTEVTVNIVNEKIEYVKMRFLEAYSSSFLTALSEKYGNPSTSKNTVYQNGFGESFDGITATWTMPDAVLTFTQYDGDKDWGRVELMSNSYRTQLNKAYDSSMQNIKDKM